MYSIVLMMALSTGADQPAGLFSHGCHGGCHGCSGSCSGYSSCSGCTGGGCHGCHGGHHARRSCHGCHGGHRARHGCHGCHGGSSCSGCHGSYGCTGGYGCTGAYGAGGCYGGAPMMGAPVGAPVVVPGGTTVPAKPPEPIKKPKKKGEGEVLVPTPATIIVSLPAEAKLTVDGAVTRSTSATRVFASPALQPGMEYYYTLKAEIVRNGKTVPAQKRVAVRAGAESRVSFEFPTTTAVASK